jgi:predicted PurR-regulated permease PerM
MTKNSTHIRPRSFDNSQLVPFLVLVGVVAAFGILFYQVIKPMILPLFLAAVIAMLADPLQKRIASLVGGSSFAAAAVVVAIIVLALLGPLATGVYLAGKQLAFGITRLQETVEKSDVQSAFDPNQNPTLAALVERIQSVADIDAGQIRSTAIKVASGVGQALYTGTVELLSDVASFCFSLLIFLIALFFFLVDGEKVLKGWEDLTPMDAEHDRILRVEFSKVCRGVVWATVAAAMVQGLLLGFGVWLIELFIDADLMRWIFLLSLLTVVFAMIPFVGATAVWLPVALYLLYQGHYLAGGVLVVYGLLVVSTADNFIKVWVLKGQASMHPLLVLVCVFGGIKLVGILGAFIGPIVGAVLVALMRILKKELFAMSRSAETASVRPSSQPLRRPRPLAGFPRRYAAGSR